MAYTLTAKQFFEAFPKAALAADSPLRKVGGVVEFEIQGKDGGTWWLDLNRGEVTSKAQKADCLLRAQARDFVALVEGRMSVSDGILTERLVVAGESGRLMTLMTALEGFRASA